MRTWESERASLAALQKHNAQPQRIAAARAALALARTEHIIAKAIEQAPPLDPDTLARLRNLIPAAPTGGAE